MSDRYKGIFFASFAAILWGFLAIALKVSLKSLSPVEISWVRFIVAFSFLSVYYLFYNRSAFIIFKKPPAALILAGLLLGLNYLGFITGIHFTSPGTAQIFIQLGPIFLTLAAFIFFKEKVSLKQVAGIIIAFAGLSVFYYEQIPALVGDIHTFNKGILWLLAGAVCWACYAILQKGLVKRHNPMQLNLILFAVPAVLYIPFIHFSRFSGISTGYLLLLLFLGLNTLGAYGSLAFALKYLEANKISIILIQNPIITFVVLMVLQQMQVTWIKADQLNLIALIGAAMVITGGILTVLSGRKKNTANNLKKVDH